VKSAAEQLELIRRGTEQIEPFPDLLRKLLKSVETGIPLRVKYGIDPTGIDVHLGHTVPLRKLRTFQELGHQAVLIIGTYTALVGDPSGRDETRARLTEEAVEANANDYLKQIARIIDIDKTEVRRNGDWFSRYSFLDVLTLTSKMTVQRMMERDDFTKRREAGTAIHLHECLYPLMQGQDSVEVRADVELGGSEQLFSLMVARRLQADAGQAGQVCITLPILRGLDGIKRMGKSLGNYVGVGMNAKDQFSGTMSIPDTIMGEWLTLLTDRTALDIATIIDPVKTHPMEAKKTLAADIVRFYHGDGAASKARSQWEQQFSEKQDPDEIPTKAIDPSILVDGKVSFARLLVAAGLAASGGEAKRLFGPNSGVSYGPERTKVTDPNEQVDISGGLIVRVGSRKIVRVKPG